MNESLTKREIIRDASTLKALARSAFRVRNSYMGVGFLPNGKLYHRIVVFPRRGVVKIRGVARNRIRRIGKEMFRQNKEYLPTLCGDIALSLWGSVVDRPHAERVEAFGVLMRMVSKKMRKHE